MTRKKIGKLALFTALTIGAFVLGSAYQKVEFLGQGSGFLVPKVSASQTINAKNLKKLLDSGEEVTFINVHTPYEGEIMGTDNFIAYDEFVANQAKLPADKNARVVVYCKSGSMSTSAVRTLRELGYKNTSHLEGGMDAWKKAGYDILDLANLPDKVLPESGFELPISWGDIGPQLLRLGVIDQAKFEKIIKMTDDQKQILTRGSDKNIKIDASNSQFVVDMLWGFGLAQKSLVYDEGPMGKEYKDKAGSFASTGGWTLARGSAMEHYNKHSLVALTPEEHKRVMDIAQNVYRPCCGNHTAFPDCNHGMAALAAIELMVKKGVSDDDIYRSILRLNSFWFGSSYLSVATYFERQGVDWNQVDAKEVLGSKYSSGQGAGNIAKQVGELPFQQSGGGGCGV